MFELPVYFISDNHFNITIDSDEKERRNKFYHVIDKIKSSSCGPPAAREVIATSRMAVLAHLMYQLTSLYGVIFLVI